MWNKRLSHPDEVLRITHGGFGPPSQQFLRGFLFFYKKEGKKELICIFIVELETTICGRGRNLLFKESTRISEVTLWK